jgi:hypothetical protein
MTASESSSMPVGVIAAEVFLTRLRALGLRSSSRLVVDYLPDGVSRAFFAALVERADASVDVTIPGDSSGARTEALFAIADEGFDIIPWLVVPPEKVWRAPNRGSEGFASTLRDHFATGEARPRILVVITAATIETQKSAQDTRADRAMITLDLLLDEVLDQASVPAGSPLRTVARAYRAHRGDAVEWVRFLEAFQRYVDAVAERPPEEQGEKLPMLGCFLKDARPDFADGERVRILEDKVLRQRQRGEGRLFDNAVLRDFLFDTFSDPIVDPESALIDVFEDEPERARKIAAGGEAGLESLDFGTFAGMDQKRIKRQKNQFERAQMVVEGAAYWRAFGQGTETVLVVASPGPFVVRLPLLRDYEPRKERARIVQWDPVGGKVVRVDVQVEKGAREVSFPLTPNEEGFVVCQVALTRGPRTITNPIDSITVAIYRGSKPEIVVEEGRQLSIEDQAWVAEGTRAFHRYAEDTSEPIAVANEEPLDEGTESNPRRVLRVTLQESQLRPRVVDEPVAQVDNESSDGRYAYEALLELACSTVRLGHVTTVALQSCDHYLDGVVEIHEGAGRYRVDLARGNTREIWASPEGSVDPFANGRAVAMLLADPAHARLERRGSVLTGVPAQKGEPPALARFRAARERALSALRAIAERLVPRFRRRVTDAAVPLMLLPLYELGGEIGELLAAWNAAVDDTSEGKAQFGPAHEALLQTDTLRVYDNNGALERVVVLPTHPWVLSAMLAFQARCAKNIKAAEDARAPVSPRFKFDLTREEILQLVPRTALEHWYFWHGVTGVLRLTDSAPFHLEFLPEDRHVHRTPLDYVGRVVANKVGRYLRMHPHLRDERRTLRVGFVNPGDGRHLLAGLETWLRNLMREHSGRIRELPMEQIPAIEVYLFARQSEIASAGSEFARFFQEQVGAVDEDVVRQALAARIQYRVSAASGPTSPRDAVHLCFVHGLVDVAGQRDKSGQLGEWWDGGFGDGLLATWLRRTTGAGHDGALHSRRGLWIDSAADGLRGGLARILSLQRGCRYGDLARDSGIFWESALPELRDLAPTYTHSDWVVHLDRELSLEIFRRGAPSELPTIIEYSDQEVPESPGYDTITVTRRAEPYREQLGEILTTADLDVAVRPDAARRAANKILDDINVLSGSWALDFLLGSIADQRMSMRLKGNVGAALAYRWLRRMEMSGGSAVVRSNVGEVVPVVISLEDLLRATPAAGLTQKEGLVYRYTNEVSDDANKEAARWCDDLLVLYVTPTEPGARSQIYGRVIEVKFGKTARGAVEKAVGQVRNTQRLLHERLSGDDAPLDAPFRHKQLSLLIKAQLEQAVAMGTMPAEVLEKLNLPALSANLATGRYEVDYELSVGGQHLKGDAFLLDTSPSPQERVEVEVTEGVRVVTIPRKLVEWLAFELDETPTLAARPESTLPRLGRYRSVQTETGVSGRASMVIKAPSQVGPAASVSGVAEESPAAKSAPASPAVFVPHASPADSLAEWMRKRLSVRGIDAINDDGNPSQASRPVSLADFPKLGTCTICGAAPGAECTNLRGDRMGRFVHAFGGRYAAFGPSEPSEAVEDAEEAVDGDEDLEDVGDEPSAVEPPALLDEVEPPSTVPESAPAQPSIPMTEPGLPLEKAVAIPVKSAPYPDDAVVDAVKRLEKALVGHKVRLTSSPSARETDRGPRLLRAYVRLEAGESIGAVRRISEDIARVVGTATSDIHITNVPERHAVGLDLPLPGLTYAVSFDEVMNHVSFEAAQRELRLGFCAGIDVTGRPVWVDLSAMPHMLVAGTTGSGKTVFLRNLILTLLLNNGPGELVLRLSSSKPMDFRVFTQAPQCGGREMAREPLEARALADELVAEMERRYELIDEAMCDNLAEFNAENPQKAEPFIVAVFDEYAEMIASFPEKTDRDAFEGAIGRLAQKARAAGIHLVVCMQRPDANALKGGIKSNILHRFALKLPQNQDSRIILDENGAETLLGQGDMLYKDANSRLYRLQVPFLENASLKRVLKQAIDGGVQSVDLTGLRTCPKCGKEGTVGDLFGTRRMKSKRRDGTEVVVERAQSYCTSCRSS